MNDNFYRAFEERYRGSRELVKSRLSVYLPFIEPLLTVHPQSPVIDLGCGRGEWLELLQDLKVEARGVDLDEGMLSACRERNFNVTKGDAIDFLRQLPDESVIAVSGFHLVEHIAFAQLQEMVRETLRVLKPGGLVIMETPNPENIIVGACNFYLDPTHARPIPPPLLAFLPEYYGFARIKVLRLQEAEHLRTDAALNLLDVLSGASPDYSVIAQKSAETKVMQRFDDLFARDYGLTLEQLGTRYHQLLLNTQAKGEEALAQARQAEASAQQAEEYAQRVEVQAQQAMQTLRAVYESASWRLTSPLRWLNYQWAQLKEEGLAARILALGKKIARPVLHGCMRFADLHPRLFGNSHPVATFDQELLFSNDTDETSPARMPGELTIDELLSRIRAELASDKEKRKQQ